MLSNAHFAESLAAIVGDRFLWRDDAIGARYRTGIGSSRMASPGWLAKPGSTQDVSRIMRLAHDHAIPVTVIGGQSGTCGAAVPSDGGLALSLERMDRVIEIDTLSMVMVVEAGCILQRAQEAAEAQSAFLPLDLGARGSAMIGGVIGTNAGGNRVIRWGMMRDMVLGLEVVLADGTVVSSLTGMLKDNAGYAWKQLMVGSEGTLGIVTQAVLRLRPLPTSRHTALLAMPSFDAAIAVLRRLEVALSGLVSSFELMWGDFYFTHTEAQLPLRPRPMALGHPIYALVETMGGNGAVEAELLQDALAELLGDRLLNDVVIAQSGRERDALWAIREDLNPGYMPLRPFAAYDVSMRIARMPAFVEQSRAAILHIFPEATVLFYGHAGDGNLHMVVSIGRMDEAVKFAFDSAIYALVREIGGSIAAEHGIGTARMDWLGHTRSEAEIAVMRSIRRAFDPKRILNPGKLFGPG